MPPVVFHPAIKKDLRKLPDGLVDFLETNILKQLEQPNPEGIALRGSLHGLYKIRFRFEKQSYRLVFQILEDTTRFVLMIGKRGEFYERLELRLK